MTSHPTIPASSSLPFFVFDVESVGLHGEAFAVAGGIYMPWGPSSSAPSVDDFTVALPPDAGQMIEDNFAALALPNPIQ